MEAAPRRGRSAPYSCIRTPRPPSRSTAKSLSREFQPFSPPQAPETVPQGKHGNRLAGSAPSGSRRSLFLHQDAPGAIPTDREAPFPGVSTVLAARSSRNRPRKKPARRSTSPQGKLLSRARPATKAPLPTALPRRTTNALPAIRRQARPLRFPPARPKHPQTAPAGRETPRHESAVTDRPTPTDNERTPGNPAAGMPPPGPSCPAKAPTANSLRRPGNLPPRKRRYRPPCPDGRRTHSRQSGSRHAPSGALLPGQSTHSKQPPQAGKPPTTKEPLPTSYFGTENTGHKNEKRGAACRPHLRNRYQFRRYSTESLSTAL